MSLMVTHPVVFNKLAFSGSLPTTKTSLAMTPFKSGETHSRTAADPANAARRVPAAAAGEAPNTGMAAKWAPLETKVAETAFDVSG